MSRTKRFFGVLKNKWVITLLVVVAIVFAYVLLRGPGEPNFDSVAAVRGDVIEEVSVTGTVSPVDKADLAFKKSGVIYRIAVKVGDRVKAGDLIASIDAAADKAALASAQAQLDELKRGLRPEEYALYSSNLSAASTTLANARQNAVNAVLDGYIKAQSAVVNYTDTFFDNPQSANPRINISVQSSTKRDEINFKHLVVSDHLSRWKQDNDAVTAGVSSDPVELVSRAEGYLSIIKSFMSDLSTIVNDLNSGSSGMTQAEIDADVTIMNTGLSTLTSAISSINTASTALKNAEATYAQASRQFSLQLAGSSPDAVAAQEARVAAAQAAVDDSRVVSPIDGLVTRADPSVGEFVTAGKSGFAVQSTGGYKIEAFVPEADIAKVSLKDKASVTLDAYGSYVFFPASVSAIDPAETIVGGVPTYKVTLHFDNHDERVRSGMTANTEILTNESKNVLVVPSRAIIDDNGEKSVRLVSADGKSFSSILVSVGLKGSNGVTEVRTGLEEGQKVVTYVK